MDFLQIWMSQPKDGAVMRLQDPVVDVEDGLPDGRFLDVMRFLDLRPSVDVPGLPTPLAKKSVLEHFFPDEDGSAHVTTPTCCQTVPSNIDQKTEFPIRAVVVQHGEVEEELFAKPLLQAGDSQPQGVTAVQLSGASTEDQVYLVDDSAIPETLGMERRTPRLTTDAQLFPGAQGNDASARELKTALNPSVLGVDAAPTVPTGSTFRTEKAGDPSPEKSFDHGVIMGIPVSDDAVASDMSAAPADIAETALDTRRNTLQNRSPAYVFAVKPDALNLDLAVMERADVVPNDALDRTSNVLRASPESFPHRGQSKAGFVAHPVLRQDTIETGPIVPDQHMPDPGFRAKEPLPALDPQESAGPIPTLFGRVVGRPVPDAAISEKIPPERTGKQPIRVFAKEGVAESESLPMPQHAPMVHRTEAAENRSLLLDTVRAWVNAFQHSRVGIDETASLRKSVVVKVHLEADTVDVRFLAESPDMLDLLQGNRSALEADLKRLGFEKMAFSFDLSHQGRGYFPGTPSSSSDAFETASAPVAVESHIGSDLSPQPGLDRRI